MDVMKAAEESARVIMDTVRLHESMLQEIAMKVVIALQQGGKLLLCGNGGSAADSQHIAAEFVNRFKMDRNPLPAIALTTDTSILTAISNDFSFDEVFKKQVEALGNEEDVLLGISTSGTSKNVIMALETARRKGLLTIGLCGKKEGPMDSMCDFVVKAQSTDTPRIQETHIFIGHILCELIERSLFGQ